MFKIEEAQLFFQVHAKLSIHLQKFIPLFTWILFELCKEKKRKEEKKLFISIPSQLSQKES